MSQTFPTEPSELSVEWLTAAMHARGGAPDARVASFAWEPVAVQGATSDVVRITLTYVGDGNGGPSSVVAKFAPGNERRRRRIHRGGAYRREIDFYRVFGSDAGIPVPACLAAEIDEPSGAFVLLLEDMHESRGGDFRDRSPGDVELAVRHLARFHARWWRSPALAAHEFLRFPGSAIDRELTRESNAALKESVGEVRRRFGSRYPDVLAAAGERTVALSDPGWLRARQAANATLVHGDYHPEQMFFPHRGGGGDSGGNGGGRFAVFDWQYVRAGNGGDDLARIVVHGLEQEERERSEMDLIALYHALLVEGGVDGYALEACEQDYRFGLLWTVNLTTFAVGGMDDALIERDEANGIYLSDWLDPLAAAAEAHDVLGLLG